MHIEFTHARTPEYFHGNFAAGATVLVGPLRMVAMLVGFVGLALMVGGEFSPGSLLAGGGVLAVAALIVAFSMWRWKRAVTVPDSWRAPRTWTLTDDLFRSATEQSSVEISWQAFRSVRKESEAYMLRTPDNRIWDIPRAALTPEQDAELEAFFDGLVRAAVTTEG